MGEIAKCPRCLEWVSSAGIVGHARVQCPLCSAQYAVQELLELRPPELLILPSAAPSDPGLSVEDTADPNAPGEPAVKDETAATGQPPESVRQIVEPSDSPPAVVETAAPAADVPMPTTFDVGSVAQTPSVAHRWKAGRRRSRPLVEFVKIVLGGLAGVIIAQLILWWLPGDLRRDPFGLAPRLPTWLHWLRPDELGTLRPPAKMRHGGMAAVHQDSLVEPVQFGAADAPTPPDTL